MSRSEPRTYFGVDFSDYLILAGLALAIIFGFLWLHQPKK